MNYNNITIIPIGDTPSKYVVSYATDTTKDISLQKDISWINKAPLGTTLIVPDFSLLAKKHNTLSFNNVYIIDLYTLVSYESIGGESTIEKDLTLISILKKYALPEIAGINTLLLEHLLYDADLVEWSGVTKDVLTKAIKGIERVGKSLGTKWQQYYRNVTEPALKASAKIASRGMLVDNSELVKVKQNIETSLPKAKELFKEQYGVTDIYNHDKLTSHVDYNNPHFREMLHSIRVKDAVSKNFLNHYNNLPSDSRIRCMFKFHSNTSRASAVSPAIGNVPKKYRYLFTARLGYKIIDIDLSSIEPRIVAVKYQDEALLLDASSNKKKKKIVDRCNLTIEKEVAIKIAKRALVGFIYGQNKTSFLSSYYKRDEYEAANKIIDFIHNRYTTTAKALDYEVQRVRLNGVIETELGFKRQVSTIPPNRIASTIRNNIIQSEAADTFLMAIVSIEQFLNNNYPEAYLIFHLHDSVIIEAPNDIAEEVGFKVSDILSSAYETRFPGGNFTTKIKIGDTWGTGIVVR